MSHMKESFFCCRKYSEYKLKLKFSEEVDKKPDTGNFNSCETALK